MTNIKKTTQIDSHDHNDDEIDLIELFKTLWHNKTIIISVTIICIFFAGIISIVFPKQYKSTASFFITESDKPSNTLMGYASILGVNSPSNIESLLQNVLDSYSIKLNIAKQFESDFKNSINEYIQKNPNHNTQEYILDYIIHSKLQLHKNFNFSIDKNNLFQLSYISNNKTLSQKILNTYLSQIIAYNESLELSAEKDLITIIDPPKIPLKKHTPNTILNLLLGLILGFFSSSFFILIKAHFNSKNNG
tara:strand:+ start:11 stop:757 length:747 start_codon:yes stop_codon:yes gene_type:complete